MARLPRLYLPDQPLHVIQRGNNRDLIFAADADYQPCRVGTFLCPRGFWQRRFWEHQIRDENDFARHVDYIHFNPVKHGHGQRAVDWPYSTFHRYVREVVYVHDWDVAMESMVLGCD